MVSSGESCKSSSVASAPSPVLKAKRNLSDFPKLHQCKSYKIHELLAERDSITILFTKSNQTSIFHKCGIFI